MNFYSYTIDRASQNIIDCARNLAADVANEMLQRQTNYYGMMGEAEPLVVGPPLTPDHPDLNFYDTNQNIHQCYASTKPGACVISETISKKKISIQCDTVANIGNTHISVFQSYYGDYATFDVHCNRSLSNTHATLDAAKAVMFKYNVTITPDERLDGSRLIISTSLTIMMIFLLFFNQF